MDKVMDKMNKRWWVILGLAEIGLVMAMIVWLVYHTGHHNIYDIPLKDMDSDFLDTENWNEEAENWQIQNGQIAAEDGVLVLQSPGIQLRRGAYVIHIDYETDTDQEAGPFIDGGYYFFIKGNNFRLPKGAQEAIYHFELEEGDDLEIRIFYHGGYFVVNGVRVEESQEVFKRRLVIICFLLLLSDVLLWKRREIRKQQNVLLFILGMTLTASLPLFLKGLLWGDDLPYHLSRIEALTQEIRFGKVPVRIASWFFDGNGNASPIYYNDLFLYFPAVLRLAGFTITQAYEIYVLAVNLLTSVLSYCCFQSILKHKTAAALAAFAYVTASYRLLDIYVRSALGEYTAMTFLPLVALGVYRIYFEKEKRPLEVVRDSLLLAFGMTGIIGCHVLSTEMTAIAIGVVAVVFLKRTFQKRVLLTLCAAVAETILLSLYFLVPFLDYMKNVIVWVNSAVRTKHIVYSWAEGAFVGEFFAFFRDPFANGSVYRNARMLLTPGIILMTAFVTGMILVFKQKSDRKIGYALLLSAIFLLISSNLLPWNYIANIKWIGMFIGVVEFPWRYLGIANLFLALLLGWELLMLCGAKEDGRVFGLSVGSAGRTGMTSVIIFVCVLMSGYFTGQCGDSSYIRNVYDTLELSSYDSGGRDYVLYPADLWQFDRLVHQTGAEMVQVVEEKGTDLVLECIAGENGAQITVPRQNYKGYHVTDEEGNEYEITSDENMRISFMLPEGFTSKVYVTFKAPGYWTVALWLSIVCAGIGSYFLVMIQRQKKMGSEYSMLKQSYEKSDASPKGGQ